MPLRIVRSLPLRLVVGAVAALLLSAPSAPLRPDLIAGLSWRNLGPFRGGRVAATTGVIGEPGTFYAGFPAAGVWKTTNAGATWWPVFDGIKEVSSIGSVEVSASNPDIVYAGTGDVITGGVINEGNGVYRSDDAGATWRHLPGLDDTKQIPSMLVDLKNPNVVLVAAQGAVYSKNTNRGVYRTTDGGRTWTKTLYVDDETGIEKLARAYDMPNVVFAMTVRHYRPTPGSPGFGAPAGTTAPQAPTGTAMYKSLDGGVTWKEITGGGLPRLGGRTSIAVAQHTNAQRVYLIGNFGFYRSDDGGLTWRKMASNDSRIMNGQGGYNCGVYVDPGNPDIVYTVNTALYKSTDGGNTFTGFKGAPGGDDPQQFWIDPTNGSRMLAGYDQGAIVSLDAGKTWSSWYNQNTEQVYHVSADNSFPYWVYATQQDAGAIRTRVRGNYGAITPFDWNSVNGWEWGTIIADPNDVNTVFATGNGVIKISYPSEQWINVSPAIDPAVRARTTSSAPIAFNPFNTRELFAGMNYVFSTTDAGAHWTKRSPDLGYPKGVTPPPDSATPAPPQPGAPPIGAIETMTLSTVQRGLIWVGTSNGLIKVTQNGGTSWDDASIDGIANGNRGLVSKVEPSAFDAGTAYATIDLHTVGDYTPHVYRTRDFGKSWTKIESGLPTAQPSGSFARAIKSDTKRKGLLFLGTESGMYISFNDGDDWQSLQLNLPNTPLRDITIKGNDLIIGTYGRGIWVMDDFSPLREVNAEVANEAVRLFKPSDAVRVRRNTNADTPFPPEVPMADNPADGAIISYWLAAKPAGELTIEIADATGSVIRHLSSVAEKPVDEAAKPPHPNFWVAPPFALPADAGLNRTAWDFRYDAPNAFSHSFEINANPGKTPASPEGVLAPPGTYTVKLTVAGKSYTAPLTVVNDPRSPANAAAVAAQGALLKSIHIGIASAWTGYHQADDIRTRLREAVGADTSSDAARTIRGFLARIDSVAGNGGGAGRGGRGGPARPAPSFFTVHGRYIQQLGTQETADQAPTESMHAALAASCKDLTTAANRLKAVGADLGAVNAALAKLNAKPVAAPAGVTPPKC